MCFIIFVRFSVLLTLILRLKAFVEDFTSVSNYYFVLSDSFGQLFGSHASCSGSETRSAVQQSERSRVSCSCFCSRHKPCLMLLDTHTHTQTSIYTHMRYECTFTQTQTNGQTWMALGMLLLMSMPPS